MKIAHLISDYLPSIGGAQICVHNVAQELSKQNDDVVVITTTPDNIPRGYGYKIVRISLWYLRFLRFRVIGKYLLWYKLRQLQKEYSFDVWQVTMGYPFGVFSVGFFKKNKIPCILRCCGEDVQIDRTISYGYRLSPEVDQLVRATYHKFDKVVGMVDGVKEDYRELGIHDNDIRIIPNGVHLQRFINKKSKEKLKETFGFKGQIVLVTVGRNHPKKGYNLIPTIFQKILQKRRNVVWMVIGDGTKKIDKSVLDDDSKKRLILVDEIKSTANESVEEVPSLDLINYYNSADLFVFPSYIEIFSIALIEANAAGLPVVTSDATGCRDVIKDGYNGLLAEPGNCEMFAEKVLMLLENKELYNQICKNILKDINNYDWSVIANQYKALYEEVIQKNNS